MNTAVPLVPSYWEDLTLGDLLVIGGTRYDGPAYRYHDETISYAEMQQRALTVANAFWTDDVRPGDRVAVMIEDRPEWLSTSFGLSLIGAVPVYLSPQYGVRELQHAIDVTDVSTVVIQDQATKGTYLQKYGTVLLDNAETTSEANSAGGLSVADQLERIVVVSPSSSEPGTVGYEEFIGRGNGAEKITATDRPQVEATDPAAILFTSGTTSLPKATIRTHRNLLPHAVDLGSWYDRSTGDELLDLFPNASIAAINQMLMSFAYGCTYELADSYDPDRTVELLADRNIAWFVGVDSMFRDLLEEYDLSSIDLSAIERVGLVLVGGVDPDLAHDVEAIFDAPIENPYGMTETNAFFLRSKAEHPFDVRLLPGGQSGYKSGVRVSLADQDETGSSDTASRDEENDDEYVGEICANGITVTPGYLNDEATSAAFDERGWFHTNDVGTLAERKCGYVLHLSGRLDDMFQVGGNNVAPAEVESHIADMPGISWAGIVGIPHERLGAVPAAFVSLQPDATVSPGEVTEFCDRSLSSYKVPRTVFIIDRSEIPLADGVHGEKIRRDILREMALERL